MASADGLTSNAWRFWTIPAGDAYLAGRDNFKEVKVSFHASGRWRMGFTEEAVTKNPAILPDTSNRAWNIWDEPPQTIPHTVTAFRLIFPTTELSVKPDQRQTKKWRDTVFIEAAPAGSGKLVVVTFFVTDIDVALAHESEPSRALASLELNNGRRAQLVAHLEPERGFSDVIDNARTSATALIEAAGVETSGRRVHVVSRNTG